MPLLEKLRQNKPPFGLSHYRLILGITGITLVSCVGGFFIYQHSRKKNILPEHIQKSQEMEKENTQFEVYDLNKKTITLSSLQNKVVVINFWATWCAPCIEELPSLNELAGFYPEKLVILAVSNERTEDIKNFLMAFPGFHTNFIPSNVGRIKMLATFPVRAFPETYILDKKGKLIEKVVGPQKWNSMKWKNKIKNVLNSP